MHVLLYIEVSEDPDNETFKQRPGKRGRKVSEVQRIITVKLLKWEHAWHFLRIAR